MRNCVRVAQQTLTLYVWVRILVPQPMAPNPIGAVFVEVWRSLVARFVRDEEVAGSNPVTSTIEKEASFRMSLFLFHPAKER